MELSKDYREWLIGIKDKIRASQLKAAVAVNKALIRFYWELGQSISQRQTEWGTRFLEKLSEDLRSEFPEMKGFSVTNLKYCRKFYEYFSDVAEANQIEKSPQPGDESAIGPQAGDQLEAHPVFNIPWGHIKLIITRMSDKPMADFYIGQTIQHNWSRDVLDLQIKSNLYSRKGNAVTNFESTLPKPLSDLAQQTLKDPYVFDFLSLDADYKDRDIENQLIQHVSNILLELGKGFAFVGNQYHLEVGGQDYFMDLLFYHVKLKAYVVIELKNTRFIPEFVGKLNFYLSAVDSRIKDESDNPTIGI